MIFFVGNDGTIVKSFPSPVYQGSVNANTVYLIAPFAANMEVTLAFQLPNGVWTPPASMTEQEGIAGLINDKTGKGYAGWSYTVPNEITRKFGTVTIQFKFYASEGVVLATSSTSFIVGKGVTEDLPEEPSKDIYSSILGNMSVLRSQMDNLEAGASAKFTHVELTESDW